MQPRPLLVAVDFSELSEQAITYAVGLAQAQRNRVDLLHVAMHSLPAHAQRHAPTAVLDQIRRDEEVSALRELAALQARHIPAPHRGQLLLLRGPPAETICSVASRGYEMVVLSTRGGAGLAHILLGSVAERVVRRAPIPVLVVRPRSDGTGGRSESA